MEVIAVAVAGGLVAGVVTGGSASRLLDTRFRLVPLAVVAIAARFLVALWEPAGGWSQEVAFGIQLGSLLLVAGFCLANLRVRGLSVVLLGVAANALVVGLNGAMPLALEAGASDARRQALEGSAIYLAEDEATWPWLGQTIPVAEPMDRPVSFGDLILAVGLANAVFWASRMTDLLTRLETAGEGPEPDSPVVLTGTVTGDVSGVDAGALPGQRPARDDPSERREDSPVPALPA